MKRFHRSQTLLEVPLQQFYPNFPLIYKKVSWKTSPLVRSEILGLFGNRFTVDCMYSRRQWQKVNPKFQTLISQKRRTLSEIFIAFLESTQNSAPFSKKVSFIA